ncbi:hypothetical protein CLOP_g3748 [Closterium sp. NIES-67]|nr:hypothetical protein CLOP_g3748 [Closterium sp. NIES-67]
MMACRLASLRALGLTGARVATPRISYPLFRRSFAVLSSPRASSQPWDELSQPTGELQTTLSSSVSVSGVGLHLGLQTTVTLLPAAAGAGRVFHVVVPGDRGLVGIGADVRNVVDTRLSTVLGAAGVQESGVRVGTVEHLLSALEGCGVDNCVIRVDGGGEMPLLDGSAAVWVRHIMAAGIEPATVTVAGATAERRRWNLPGKGPITVQHGDSFIAAFPRASPLLTYGIDFPHVPAIGRQWVSWDPARAQQQPQLDAAAEHEEQGEQPQECGDYMSGIAPARTFCILEQVEQMRAAGLIKGGSLDNALVCSQTRGWVNPPLRVPFEPCRHKLLDLIGDLALCGRGGNSGIPNAHIVAYKASHALHVAFGKALIDALEAEATDLAKGKDA